MGLDIFNIWKILDGDIFIKPIPWILDMDLLLPSGGCLSGSSYVMSLYNKEALMEGLVSLTLSYSIV